MTVTIGEIQFWPRTRRVRGGPTCVDLFAGAGGLAEGFRQAGWSILAGNDVNADAGATFRLNFPEAIFFQGPVAALTADDILELCALAPGELDCLIGGPPCQSFSYNNHNRSASDDRARLFDEYLRLVSDLQPKFLVMENVPGILTIGGGSVITEIAQRLAKLGYACEHRTLSSDEFGVPQIRKRVFIIASRITATVGLHPNPTHQASKATTVDQKKGKKLLPPVSIANALGDLPVVRNGGGSISKAKYSKDASTKYQKAMRSGSKHLLNHVCNRLGEKMMQRLTYIPEGGNWRDIPFKLLPAGMKRAKPSDHTKRYGRLSRKGLASTLLTKCDPHWGAYIHPTQGRTISVREAARLQGFPDRFKFAGTSLTSHYEQIGNAVPVQVAQAVGKSLAKAIKSAPKDKAAVPKKTARRIKALIQDLENASV